MSKKVKVSSEVRELLEEIKDWMISNDYECGEQGSEIYNKISEILGDE